MWPHLSAGRRMDSSDPGGGGKDPSAGPAFYHGHGLGNDYLVFESAARGGETGWPVTGGAVRMICRKGVGPGSDGIVLLSSRHPADGVFGARGFNPDGSEFERSGNGLRVLASHLHRAGLVGRRPFAVRLGGLAPVRMTVHEAPGAGRYDVSVEMGRAEVGLAAVDAEPGRLDARGRAVRPSGGAVEFVPVSVGNPHAVVFSGRRCDRGDRSVPLHPPGLPFRRECPAGRRRGPRASCDPGLGTGSRAHECVRDERVRGGSRCRMDGTDRAGPGAGPDGRGDAVRPDRDRA